MAHRVDTEDVASLPADPTGVETIEAYEIDGGVVLYDAQNPLAWVEGTEAVRLDDSR